MLWAAMPEASVNENGEPATCEDNVWPGGAFIQGNGEIHAVTQISAVQQSPYLQLWAGVPTAIPSHYRRDAGTGRFGVVQRRAHHHVPGRQVRSAEYRV